VRKETDLFQDNRREVLGFLNNQQGRYSMSMALDEKPTEAKQKVTLRSRTWGQPQILCHIGKELATRETRIEYERITNPLLVKKFLQTTNDQSFSGSYLSGQKHEPFAGLDPVKEARECFLMLSRRVEHRGIRTDLEGAALQMEIRFVHG
ncbi:MAG TPA: hypothetical protein VN843_11325, partial [Anaerolineales bacterium]|nr:hypothetical protein [Anaerolineales bacterium]